MTRSEGKDAASYDGAAVPTGGTSTSGEDSIGPVVRAGLMATPKSLPPFLFYDAEGSEQFEAITQLPEYYPTRVERAILEARSGEIAKLAVARAGGDLAVLELGAGTATKTELLLRALVAEQGRTHFIPADVSDAALESAEARLHQSLPEVHVHALHATHPEALAHGRGWNGPLLVVFLGSSLGNYEETKAIEMLKDIRATLGPERSLLLGTDVVKPLDVLLPAYDDAQGVTAAFNRNVLGRINRELGGRFDLERFRHVAEWNAELSCVDLFLESRTQQVVPIDDLEVEIEFAAGERIHTESSFKYDTERLDAMFAQAGLAREHEFYDPKHWFRLTLARPA
ncbi:MAG: L-histidine N(alpha)-methyltransferase [Candidatus Eisenbacteria bacterium]|uniref:L-histidine N(Alpha)-methyltransferase n=1 Tax=Eiseniibacteriota bacterium TaxID=2212470 RepID=A0A956SEA1_UNCEI|nr:L-histidine N(alpha)-methyltransferase [Candidatus Eisenbacteria bacterium]